MKHTFTTLDVVCMIRDLQTTLVGLRVDQIYDVDKKTYLIRLVKSGEKRMLLLEAGVRFHSTTFEWPKNPAPSGFTMKLRKHLANKRLEKISQVGADRIVDFQFGADAVAVHVFLELYDRGNLILTDCDYNILNLVRPRIQGAERLAAHEQYDISKAKQQFSIPKSTVLELVSGHGGKSLREVFLSKIEFGLPLFAHVLRQLNLAPNTKIPVQGNNQGIDTNDFGEKMYQALENGRNILENDGSSGGFIVLTFPSTTKHTDPAPGDESEDKRHVFYDQFHPTLLLSSYEENKVLSFPTMDAAVDEYFCKIESQKIDMKQMNQEKEALKKLEKVKLDQLKRIEELKVGQEMDKHKAELITMNQTLVDAAITVVRTLVANQIPWDEIWDQIKAAQANEDPIASAIVKLQLIKNQFVMSLKDPYLTPGGEESTTTVEIDLGLSAYANATKYYDQKRQSAKKEERTLESQDKAIKSTEKKTLAALKEVATIHSIKKARKVLWFEKFRWFISSENYLVLCGRDAQQNELLVKRYLNARDIYLHADAHGAPTVIIKNDEQALPVLPKTLNEAGCFAVSCSGSWDSKVVTTAWWVWGNQVSKSAPTGEYLPTGSFMIRGRKNYLPPVQLVLGFGFMFKITDESMKNHISERARRTLSTSSEKGSEADERLSKMEEKDIFSDLGDNEFPDTQVKVKLSDTTRKVQSQSSAVSVTSETTLFTDDSRSIVLEDTDDSTIVVSTGLVPQVITAQQLQRDRKKAEKKGKIESLKGGPQSRKVLHDVVESDTEDLNLNKAQQEQKPKRGHHGRIKKMKEKYKDQDEEERELRMRLLRGEGSANSSPAKKGKGKSGKNGTFVKPPPRRGGDEKKLGDKRTEINASSSKLRTEEVLELPLTSDQVPEPAVTTLEEETCNTKSLVSLDEVKENTAGIPTISKTAVPTQELETLSNEPENADDDEAVEIERNVLDSLTGCPLENDELLFAVPVIAPYSTLQNYKFKIKLIPGTTKRGKAAKNALESFLRDKSSIQREKDLLKSVKDQDLARNFPGKVKLAGGLDKK